VNASSDDIKLGAVGPDEGPGEQLRRARERAGHSLEDISARLHLDKRTLESLESDDFENLPAPTFVRGYLRSYARLLQLAPEPVVHAFDRRGFSPPALIADIATRTEARSSDWWVVATTVGIAGVLVVLAVIWFQAQRSELPGDRTLDTVASSPRLAGTDTNDETLAPGAESPPEKGPISAVRDADTVARDHAAGRGPGTLVGQGLEGPAARSSDGETPAAGSSPLGAGQGTAPRPAVEANPAESTATGPSTAPARTAASSGAPGQASAESPGGTSAEVQSDTSETPERPIRAGSGARSALDNVKLELGRRTWVELYDGTGKRLYYNLAEAGDIIAVKGKPPIRAVLGYVKGVRVEYNGAPYDFSKYVRKGLARFEFRR